MARESIATLKNCNNPLIWSQLRIELLGKVELASQAVEALLINRAGAVLMSGTKVQIEAEASRLSDLNTHQWDESYDLHYSIRSAVAWLTGRDMHLATIPKICIKSNGQHLGKFILGMVCKDFYSGDGQVEEAYRIDNGDYVRRGTWAVLNGSTYNAYTKLDANNPADMNRLRTMLGFRPINMDKPHTVETIEECISAGLVQFIAANPQDEMVLGFLLKETGMRLSKEVQAGGVEAIHKFILDETNAKLVKQFELYKAGEAAMPKLPEPADDSVVVKFNRYSDLTITRVLYREDHQEFTIKVPKHVIDEADAEGDHGIITNWIYEHHSQAVGGRTREGSESESDNGDRTEESDHWNCDWKMPDGSELEP